jgi:carboxypeptidase Q
MRRSRSAAVLLVAVATLAALAALGAPGGGSATSSLPLSGGSAGAARSSTAAAAGGETVDLEVVTRIRDEGFHRSQALATIAYLADRIGARLTGTPELKEANEWARRRLAGWGLANAHLEAWGPFGRGWSFSRAVVAMRLDGAERQVQLAALPKAWTPGTQGEVRGEALRVTIETAADMDRYRGKLAGKVALLDKARDVSPAAARVEARRFTAEKLAELAEFDPGQAPRVAAERQARRERLRLRDQVRKFLYEEKALASIEASSRPWGLIQVQGGGPHKQGEQPVVTGLVMAAEPYNRLVRLLDAGRKVELAIDVQARYYDDDPMAYNTLAEIPGSDPRGEVVMAGAHLDSWHAATGATDNGAGCAVVMEAGRILAALHLVPRRTIRIALWTGEEEGLLGSTAYVSQHFASRPPPPPPPSGAAAEPPGLSEPPGPLTRKPEHAKLSGYFNVDNGSGKIRGIMAEENSGVQPIFSAWLAPFGDLGATTVSQRVSGGTDHVAFDRVGLPGFQFIQDELDYSHYTHHTNADAYDHVEGDDLAQASVVLASFLYHAASRPAMLPRKPPPSPSQSSSPSPRQAGGE